MRRVAVAVAPLMLAAGLASGQTPTAWIHVRVEEPRRESKVSVNLPLSVVQAALVLAPSRILSDGHFRVDGLSGRGHDLSVADLRRLWKALKDSGESELVSAQERDETVSIARRGDHLQILVTKPSEKEEVHVEIPVAVVDALFSGDGQELNLREAIDQLTTLRGDIVKVKDADSNVRIWIDERS
jgi:hypothetical protein